MAIPAMNSFLVNNTVVVYEYTFAFPKGFVKSRVISVSNPIITFF